MPKKNSTETKISATASLHTDEQPETALRKKKKPEKEEKKLPPNLTVTPTWGTQCANAPENKDDGK